jgi:hypothetical protein
LVGWKGIWTICVFLFGRYQHSCEISRRRSQQESNRIQNYILLQHLERNVGRELTEAEANGLVNVWFAVRAHTPGRFSTVLLLPKVSNQTHIYLCDKCPSNRSMPGYGEQAQGEVEDDYRAGNVGWLLFNNLKLRKGFLLLFCTVCCRHCRTPYFTRFFVRTTPIIVAGVRKHWVQCDEYPWFVSPTFVRHSNHMLISLSFLHPTSMVAGE